VQLSIRGQNEFDISPNQTAMTLLDFKLSEGIGARPGFYHLFVRFEGGPDLVSYAWVEVRNPGQPEIDKHKGVHPEVIYADGALDFDLNRDIAVVYGTDCPGWEVESAWLIYQTLESATGRPVRMFQLNDLPEELPQSGSRSRWVRQSRVRSSARLWTNRRCGARRAKPMC
jgi:hypothetical protein